MASKHYENDSDSESEDEEDSCDSDEDSSDSDEDSSDSDDICLQGIDERTKLAIEKLFHKTIDKTFVGKGADAKEIKYKTLKVLKIQRVVNPYLRENYDQKKAKMRSLNKRRGLYCTEIGELRHSSGDVKTKQNLSGKLAIDVDVNEHFLFHGTLRRNVDSIVSSGLDPQYSNKRSMFGPGVYCAEMSSKADQYADEEGNRKRNGTKMVMFLVRALMGHVFVCNDCDEFSEKKRSPQFKRPPCMCCEKNKCPQGGKLYYDSVLGDGEWHYREFVVYEQAHIYPEYLITYKRE